MAWTSLLLPPVDAGDPPRPRHVIVSTLGEPVAWSGWTPYRRRTGDVVVGKRPGISNAVRRSIAPTLTAVVASAHAGERPLTVR